LILKFKETELSKKLLEEALEIAETDEEIDLILSFADQTQSLIEIHKLISVEEEEENKLSTFLQSLDISLTQKFESFTQGLQKQVKNDPKEKEIKCTLGHKLLLTHTLPSH